MITVCLPVHKLKFAAAACGIRRAGRCHAALGRCRPTTTAPSIWPEPIRIVFENTQPLKHPRATRLPLFLWPAMNPGRLTDEQALTLVKQLDERGVGLVCRWDHARYQDSLAEALPVARAQKKLGLPVAIDATSLLYAFFNGDKTHRPH